MPVGLSLEQVRDIAKSRGLSQEQVRKRFIRYRDIADGEAFFFAPDDLPAVYQRPTIIVSREAQRRASYW